MFSIEFNNNNLDQIYDHYLNKFYNNSLLMNHRFFVEQYAYGYGEKPFHAMWEEIIDSFKEEINFLEIGVYKGQILSLVKLLANNKNIKNKVLGVTPLSNAGDKYSSYDNVDYAQSIKNIFQTFNLDFDENQNLLKGFSNDINIIEQLKNSRYNLIYIDGGHDYECVVSDIKLMKEILLKNGIVVFDDSSNYKTFSKNLFLGHEDVSRALKDTLENDVDFVEIMCVGHNRVFKKIMDNSI